MAEIVPISGGELQSSVESGLFEIALYLASETGNISLRQTLLGLVEIKKWRDISILGALPSFVNLNTNQEESYQEQPRAKD